MYDSFNIDNFRGLEHIELDDLRTINLISGRNNTGKTAVLEAMFLHSSGPHAGEGALGLLVPIRTGLPAILDLAGNSSPWLPFFPGQDAEHRIQLSARMSGKNVTVGMQIPLRERSNTTIQPYAQPGQTSPVYSLDVDVKEGAKAKVSFIQTAESQALSPTTPLLGNISFQITGSPNLKLTPAGAAIGPAFFLSGRSRTPQNELARRYSNLRRIGREKDFLAALKVIEPRLKGVEVLLNNGQLWLHADIGTEPPLPLPLLGEGTVTMADIITGIFEARNGVALFDEIENGIHYSVLPALWHQVGRAAKQANVQIFATTHSRECVVAAHDKFRKTPGELSLFRLRKSGSVPPVTSAVRYDLSTLGSALDLDLDVR
jgi:hypothetical protein